MRQIIPQWKDNVLRWARLHKTVCWTVFGICVVLLVFILVDFFIPYAHIKIVLDWFGKQFAYSWIETVGLLILPLFIFVPLLWWRKSRLFTLVGVVTFVCGSVLLYVSTPKTPVDVVQAFVLPASLFIAGILLKKRDDAKKKLEIDLEHEREDRSESAKVLDLYTEAMVLVNARLLREDEDKRREITLRTHHAFMRVVEKDKLRILIMLMQDDLINKRNPLILLNDADLSGIEYTRYKKNFANINFQGANLKKAKMQGKSFRLCNFSHAILTEVELDENTDFSGADLSFAEYDLAEIMKATIDHTTKFTDTNGDPYTVIRL